MIEKSDIPLVVTTTFENRNEAEELATILLQQRLIACAQISSPVSSSYWWNGEIVTATEYILIMKTLSSRYGRLEKVIQSRHSYQVPEIVAQPITVGSLDYLSWLQREINK